MKFKGKSVITMKLKIGDLVAFKKYENMTDEERSGIMEDFFPAFGKVSAIYKIVGDINRFEIEGKPFNFNTESIDHIISNSDAKRFNQGDEVLVKATVKNALGDSLQINPWIDDSDVVKVLKRIKPDCFIVQEKHYGLYIGDSGDLVSDKDRAQVYTSREDANDDAADMYLSSWNVIAYGD